MDGVVLACTRVSAAVGDLSHMYTYLSVRVQYSTCCRDTFLYFATLAVILCLCLVYLLYISFKLSRKAIFSKMSIQKVSHLLIFLKCRYTMCHTFSDFNSVFLLNIVRYSTCSRDTFWYFATLPVIYIPTYINVLNYPKRRISQKY